MIRFAECEKDPATSTTKFKEAIANTQAAVVHKLLKKSVLCFERKKLLQHFRFDCNLPKCSYVEQKTRCEDAGLLLPHVKLHVSKLQAFLVHDFNSTLFCLDNPRSALLKLMFLKMDLLDFHPLAEVCSCHGLQHLEYFFLKSFYHTLLKNAVSGFNLAARKAKCVKRRALPVKSHPAKLSKSLQNKIVNKCTCLLSYKARCKKIDLEVAR